MKTLTKAEFDTLAWAACFTVANLEGYGTEGDCYVGEASRSVRLAHSKNERVFLAPVGIQRTGDLVPTALFKREFKRRLRRLGFEVADE